MNYRDITEWRTSLFDIRIEIIKKNDEKLELKLFSTKGNFVKPAFIWKLLLDVNWVLEWFTN